MGNSAGAGPGAEKVEKARFCCAHAVQRLLLCSLVALVLLGCRPGDDGRGAGAPEGTEQGQRAPALTGTTATGESFDLGRERANATVLVFYRSVDCGLCRHRLQELQAHLAEYERSGARVVAVTADPPEGAARVREMLDLGFPVVSVDSATLARWGLSNEEQGLPLPASYLLDRRGVVAYRHIGRNAGDRANDIELLAVLAQLDRG